MIIPVDIIQSGSAGNAIVVDKRVLIDCGVGWRAIAPHTKGLELVLLTHIHGDHFKPSTIRRLASERPLLRWATPTWLVAALVDAGVPKRSVDVIDMAAAYRYSDSLTVEAFGLFHDVPNCGWKVHISGGRLFYATDTVNLDGITAPGYDMYLVEGNYSAPELEKRIEAKLAAGEFSYEARAKQTHLSEEKAMAWIAQNAGGHSRYELIHRHG